MPESNRHKIAIVDYGMGNLYSVAHACEKAGLQTMVTSHAGDISSADAVILPGVGAFGDAMEALRKRDLVKVLQDISASSKPFMGICLGMHLLMEEGNEFGCHEGLKIISGAVNRFESPKEVLGKVLKVPEVQWNRIFNVKEDTDSNPWSRTMLNGLADGEYMYFVHSFYAVPKDPDHILSISKYGHVEFCSCIRNKNIFACQFHPERSGKGGLQIYHNLAQLINGEL